jgi:lysophospholipase L1-like esterase
MALRLAVALALTVLCGCRTLSPSPVLPTQVSPYAPELAFSGRIERSDPRGPRFAWGGTSLTVRFTGTSLALRLAELPKSGHPLPNRYRVRIDDGPPFDLYLSPSPLLYRLAERLRAGPHVLRLERETEAFVGESQLLGLELDPGASLLPAPPPPARRLEFLGDSGMTGYGIEAPGPQCSYSVETQRASLAYPALVARVLGAEATVLAWAGKGVSVNYGDDPSPTLPQLYSRWEFQSWVPHAVVIHLGANDLKSKRTTDEGFISAYASLVGSIRQHYPEAHVLCVLGPTLRDDWPPGARRRARALLSKVLELRQQAGDTRVHLVEVPPRTPEEGVGCDWHPSPRTHQRVAEQFIPLLSNLLGWE